MEDYVYEKVRIPHFAFVTASGRVSKKFQTPILPSDKVSPDMLISIYEIFPTILNDLFKSFSRIAKDGLQGFQGQLVPSPVKISSTARNTRSLIVCFNIPKTQMSHGLRPGD
jgi:hypothetical protein